MNTSVVITVISDDRPGIVESLSDLLHRHQGNWTESSMMSLAGKFAGILLASVPADQADGFLAALDKLEAGGLQVVAQCSDSAVVSSDARGISLDLVGQDHPGIVHQVTEVLTRFSINVLELETHCQSASMSGENLFHAHARLLLPADAPVRDLRKGLEDLANELMVDIKIED